MRFRRRREPLPEISRKLHEPREYLDDVIDDSDAKEWERANPAKAAATKSLRLRRGAFWGGKRMIIEVAPREEDTYTGD
jgi:hypothetical protein